MKAIQMVPLQINFVTNTTNHNPTLENEVTSNSDTVSVSPQEKERLKNRARKILVGLILSLSAVIYGYSLKEITSVPVAVLMKNYSITLDKFTTQSILIGILPLGSLVGAVITHFMLQKTERLSGMYIYTVVNIIAVVLININNFGSLVAGRFLEGTCVGYYTLLAPIYLREIAPKQLRRLLGLFFSFGKIIGVLIAVAMELIFSEVVSDIFYRIILSMTGLFSIIQAILVFIFCSQTPTEMIERGKAEEAKKIIERFYKEQYVNEVFAEYQKEHEIEHGAAADENRSQNLHNRKNRKQSYNEFKKEVDKVMRHNQLKQEETLEDITENKNEYSSDFNLNVVKMQSEIVKTMQFETKPSNINANEQKVEGEPIKEEEEAPKALTFEEKKNSAYCVGVHLCIIRHWTGANAIISQGGLFVTTFSPGIGHYTSLIINLFQGVFIVVGLVWIQSLVGKRPLFLFSIMLLSLTNIGLVIAMVYKNVLVILFLMCAYMVIYGGSFSSPIWAYPSEVIPARKSLFSNIVHWLALAISTLVPPIIGGIMPDSNPFPVFLFFAFYGIFSFFHIFRFLRESDGKTFAEIINSYK